MFVVLSALLIASATSITADTGRCLAAEQFLREAQRMTTVIDADTVDDWRTGKRLEGCRVTAAGSSDVDVAQEAARLYVRLRAGGWTRTPDPRDAPTESSLRFRRQGNDCLFNLYQGALLLTESEGRVIAAHEASADERTRYQVFVQCVESLPAAAR
ncbi:MAG: hypothetical protein ABIT38_15610 [Gemmatimonadaceae bacterium]